MALVTFNQRGNPCLSTSENQLELAPAAGWITIKALKRGGVDGPWQWQTIREVYRTNAPALLASALLNLDRTGDFVRNDPSLGILLVLLRWKRPAITPPLFASSPHE
jgi:hypothetical protein